MTEIEAKERLEDLIDTCNKGIEMHPYDKELFETDKKALETVLQLLEQKDNKINKVIDKLKLFKNDLKAYEDVRNNHYVPIGAVGIRINELLKILEE